MATRPCLDCKRPANNSRCPDCTRARDRARGSAHSRGYDSDYERAKLEPEYLAATHCAECDKPFTDDNPKTGGHSVALRHGGKGSKVLPHCRDCNYGWLRSGL